jgi:hypothetical protein
MRLPFIRYLIRRYAMSKENTRKIVSRAVTDVNFRRELFNNPDAILSQYDLTDSERHALRSIPTETIDDFANQLEKRISMSLVMFGAEASSASAASGQAANMQAAGAHSAAANAASQAADASNAVGANAAGAAAGAHSAAAQAASQAADASAAGIQAAGAQAPSASMSWLERLAEALGFGGDSSKSDLY